MERLLFSLYVFFLSGKHYFYKSDLNDLLFSLFFFPFGRGQGWSFESESRVFACIGLEESGKRGVLYILFSFLYCPLDCRRFLGGVGSGYLQVFSSVGRWYQQKCFFFMVDRAGNVIGRGQRCSIIDCMRSI